jgi:hypothetical protein
MGTSGREKTLRCGSTSDRTKSRGSSFALPCDSGFVTEVSELVGLIKSF